MNVFCIFKICARKNIYTISNNYIMVCINVLASVNPNNKQGNLGDIFGYVLMENLCKPFNIEVKRLGTQDNIENNTFSLIGSICHLCNSKAINKKIIIIGCGIIKKDNTLWNNNNIKWIGVRDPETLKLINKNCQITSDPGLLISNIFKLKSNPIKKIGYIIHSVDRKFFLTYFLKRNNILLIITLHLRIL